MGFRCPPSHNPAEFLLDLVSVDTGSAADEARGLRRVARLSRAWAAEEQRRRAERGRQQTASSPPAPAAAADAPGARRPDHQQQAPRRPLGPLRVFGLLLRRSVTQARRNIPANASRLVAHVILGLVFGGMNRNLGRSQKSVQRRAALLLQARRPAAPSTRWQLHDITRPPRCSLSSLIFPPSRAVSVRPSGVH